MDGRMDGGRTDGWMVVWVDGGRDGLMVGQMDTWMEGGREG